MLFAIVLLVALGSPELELSAGLANPSFDATPGSGPATPVFNLRAGLDLGNLTLSLGGLAVAGISGGDDPCFTTCDQNGSFKALSALGLVRLHTSGTLQLYVEGGAGVGRLFSLSEAHTREDPVKHGRLGPSLWLGGGGRWLVSKRAVIGLNVAWTTWTNVSFHSYRYGSSDLPGMSGLNASALLVQGSLGWSFGQ